MNLYRIVMIVMCLFFAGCCICPKEDVVIPIMTNFGRIYVHIPKDSFNNPNLPKMTAEEYKKFQEEQKEKFRRFLEKRTKKFEKTH